MTDLIGHTGIHNNGNQCYFNSILQSLASCPSIYIILKQYLDTSKLIINIITKYNIINLNHTEIIKKCDELLLQVEDEEEKSIIEKIKNDAINIYIFVDWFIIMNLLISNNSGCISVLNLVQKLRIIVEKKGYGDLFSGEQCDSNEALIFLLDTLHQSCSTPLKSPIPDLPIVGLPDTIIKQYQDMYIQQFGKKHSHFIDLFQNTYLSIIKCKNCSNQTINISPMSVIDIPLHQSKPETPVADLNACMLNYFQPENLDEYTCEKCLTKNTCYLKKGFLKLADTIIIVVKRFIQMANGRIAKNNINLQFPEIIDLGTYLVQTENEPKPHQYHLTSTICHISHSIGFGHYVSFIKKLKDKCWYFCSDGNIRKCEINDVLSQGITGMLFYSKIK